MVLYKIPFITDASRHFIWCINVHFVYFARQVICFSFSKIISFFFVDFFHQVNFRIDVPNSKTLDGISIRTINLKAYVSLSKRESFKPGMCYSSLII